MRTDPEAPEKVIAERVEVEPMPRRLLALRGKADLVGDVVGAFESETVAVYQRTTPKSQHAVLYVFLVMILLMIALSAVASVERVVTGIGKLVTLTPQIYVNALNNSIVHDVLVKPGQRVRKGQVLAVLDPTFTQAALSALQDHADADKAQISRDEAEIARRTYKYSPAKHYESLQEQLFVQRQATYIATVKDYDSRIRSGEALVAQYLSDTHEYTDRLKLARDVENSYIPLVEKGYISQLMLTQSTDARTEMERLLGDAQQQLASNREILASTMAQRDEYIKGWDSAIAQDLVTQRMDLESTVQQIVSAQKNQDLNTLVAPEDAIVVKVGMISKEAIAPGGGQTTVTPGSAPLFTLMPIGAEILAQLDIQSMDAGFVRVGDPVVVKLDDYSFVLHGTAKGTVKEISENSFTLDDNNQPASPYFRTLVKIDQLNLHDVPKDMRLVPGETLNGDIIVGERTVMQYVLEGAMKVGNQAMREP